MKNNISQAVELLNTSKYVTAFTGAGISVESGIPPFRGTEGLWSQYDPIVLDIDYFKGNPLASWEVIKKIFYDFFEKARPNAAHVALAKMEQLELLKKLITQNIDNLHREAGSKEVVEFHGNSHVLVCLRCNKRFSIGDINLNKLPVRCDDCGGLIKPDFIFFGEDIPPQAYQKSIEAAKKADVFLVIGTSGEVMPASQIPLIAKQTGAKIIEVNTQPSKYTNGITDIFLQGRASEVLSLLAAGLYQD